VISQANVTATMMQRIGIPNRAAISERPLESRIGKNLGRCLVATLVRIDNFLVEVYLDVEERQPRWVRM
jgi:hypothetical protein